jgi:hypothetical protein
MSSAQVSVSQELAAASETVPVRRLQDFGLVLLLLLPLAILALNSRWIFSGPYRDAWVYYGLFHDAPAYVRASFDQYYSTRLSVILLGYGIHHLLPPLAANVVLHLLLYWTAVLSVYFTAWLTLGSRTALLAALAMGGYPFFLFSAGWNYVDGFGIAFAATAFLTSTLAARCRRWPLFLALAGAAATALVSANLFYAVYLPFLAAHFVLVNLEFGRRSLLGSLLFAAVGAAGLFTLFGLVNRAFGGPFLYLFGSLRWSQILQQQANPFRHPISTWLPGATWLAVPAAILLCGLALLERVRQMPAGPRRRFAVAWQLQYIAFAALMTLLQATGDMAVLETSYYASLLIPFAFLALAGQLAWLVEGLTPRAYAALAALGTFAQLLPPALAGQERVPELMRYPTLLPFAAGAAAAAVLWLGAKGPRAGVAFLVCLGLAQVLMSNVSPIFRRFDGFDGRGGGLFLQLDRGVAAIRESDPSHRTRLWYDLGEKNGGLYDAIASAFLFCPQMINHEFPHLGDGRACDSTPLGPGLRIALLSSRPDAFAQAAESLHGIGLSSRFVGRREIPGPAADFAITFLETAPAESPAPAEAGR